ncbi:hypothetical protein FV242_21900 [Methylobacterium sp. WL64]|uniref:hypothetical protein n=1 Tax=Methylobacterium sp. WL64 TaxID=2603894 RepID=UPI0011CBA6B4|nr:hypothetical protein [Methylobacterium sp. WL64]TXN00492.1 hypothetical protein FV242_21900 [Methylobacterium sp. WL64]
MRIREIETRIARLEAKRGTDRFDHLSYDQAELALFDRLHRSSIKAGGIDELMDEWDAAEDPQEQHLIARIRHCTHDVATYYRDLRARLS